MKPAGLRMERDFLVLIEPPELDPGAFPPSRFAEAATIAVTDALIAEAEPPRPCGRPKKGEGKSYGRKDKSAFGNRASYLASAGRLGTSSALTRSFR